MLLPAMKKLCTRIRLDILTMTTTAGSGHPTSSLSAVELMSTLYFKFIRYDVARPDATNNDRVIFSKGHASPLLYALFHVAGAIGDKELATYRKFKSVLEGHPTPRFPYVDIATGSLGQGLAVGFGEAVAIQMKYGLSLQNIPRVFVLLGDGELSEGAVWEAVMAAGYHKTNNLIALADINALEQSGATMERWDTETYRKRFESFGWAVLVVDGHDLKALDTAYQKALDYRGGPTVILAKTTKGKGISFLEDKQGWHGKVLDKEQLQRALAQLGAVDTTFEGMIKKPEGTGVNIKKKQIHTQKVSLYNKPTTTREGFGKALVRLGVQDRTMIVLDGDLETSTYTHLFHEALPHQFFECHIAEQLMVSVAAGCAIQGLYPVISSYGAFLTRAVDQFRMSACSEISMMVNGSHGGVATGADGQSQMGLEDIAIFRALPHSIVLSPADAVSAEKITEMAYGYKGVAYIRTTRPILTNIYDSNTSFTIGGSHTFEAKKRNGKQIVTILATGVTVHEALKAKKQLEEQGMAICVIDCYSIKPLDEKTVRKAASNSKHLIIVEDHYPEGGLGEAVFAACAGSRLIPTVHLAVRKTPMSGSAEELLSYEKIDAQAIVEAVKHAI